MLVADDTVVYDILSQEDCRDNVARPGLADDLKQVAGHQLPVDIVYQVWS